MTEVKRSIRSSKPESLQSLKVLAGINGSSDTHFAEDPVASGEGNLLVEIEIVSSNPFNGSKGTRQVKGFSECVQTLCNVVPESGLWVDGVETWVKKVESELLDVAYLLDTSEAKEAFPKVTSFVESIEKQLSESSASFLVGEYATAADVTTSIVLSKAASRTGVDIANRSEKLASLLTSILKNTAVTDAIGDCLSDIVSKTDSLAINNENLVDEVDESSSFSDNPIIAKLGSLSIPHRTYSHPLCMTADELVKNVPVQANQVHTKNLLFKDKKHGMFLVTCKTDAEVNTKALGKALKLEGKTNLRFADEKTLWEFLQVKPGCVGPMSIMNDAENKITLVLDEGLMQVEKIHSHPLRNDASVVVTPADLLKFSEECGHAPEMIAFGTKSADSGKGGRDGLDKPSAPKSGGKSESKPKQHTKTDKKGGKKGETLLAMKWKKTENFAMWYSDAIVLSEMISYYDISGCYILRPWSYRMWELIQDWFNDEIKTLGVENSYFPLFVSQDRLEKEKDHVEGFAPEVAWVTKSGDGTLAKPIAVRPTSETIMYPAFSDWIQSHRDLPLKLNQWSNVVRWEFKDPTPFLRSREFLWQEGHTAHSTFEEADEMVMAALDLYRRVYEELLAVPVVPGYKTEKEKFAGGYRTTTVEAYVAGSGRAIQGATSHNLGQNFGKMFDITFQNEKGESEIAWQTSWGLTTRTIGVMVMVHGDDVGLVLPPRIAPLQVVIVPIVSKKLTFEDVSPYCLKILESLKSVGVRAKYDDRKIYNPGWKYNHWEQKGVPIRVEVGPRDLEQSQARVVTRHNNVKEDFPASDLSSIIQAKLVSIQSEMFIKAKNARDQHLVQVTEWKDFVPNLELNNLVLTPWCGGQYQDWEEVVKTRSKEESLKARGGGEEDARCAVSVAAKTLCIPFDQPELPEGTMCLVSGLPATCWVLWGRSY